MTSVLRSTALQLALAYAGLFIVSSLLLVGLLWWRTAAYLDREIDAVILADTQAVADRFRDFGLDGAIATVSERAEASRDVNAIYLLVDPTLAPVAGGIMVRRAVFKRVETINRTAAAIVQGDLARRVPTTHSADEFDQLSGTINEMLDQIQLLIEGTRGASDAVAHDLRTPLAEMRGRLELSDNEPGLVAALILPLPNGATLAKPQ